jgi:hypothetical protein
MSHEDNASSASSSGSGEGDYFGGMFVEPAAYFGVPEEDEEDDGEDYDEDDEDEDEHDDSNHSHSSGTASSDAAAAAAAVAAAVAEADAGNNGQPGEGAAGQAAPLFSTSEKALQPFLEWLRATLELTSPQFPAQTLDVTAKGLLEVALAVIARDRGDSFELPGGRATPALALVSDLFEFSQLCRQALGIAVPVNRVDPMALPQVNAEFFSKAEAPATTTTAGAAAPPLSLDVEIVRWTEAKPLESEVYQRAMNAADMTELLTALAVPPPLQSVAIPYLLLRRCHLTRLNRLAISAAKVVDFSARDVEGSLAWLLVSCRDLLTADVKTTIFFHFVEASVTPGARPISVRLTRQGPGATPKPMHVCDQLYQVLHALPSSAFRQKGEQNDSTPPLNVHLAGEVVQGQAGPYRQVLVDVCQELMSDTRETSLFVPSQNVFTGTGEGRDVFVPRPSNNTAGLPVYEVLGRLIGMAMRSRTSLDLSFPSLVWKRLLGQEPTKEDLVAIDHNFVHSLDDSVARVMEMADDDLGGGGGSDSGNDDDGDANMSSSAAAFSLPFESNFTCILTDGTSVDLVPAGSEIPVTRSNLARFRDLSVKARLEESSAQLASMREGLISVVPDCALALFSWRDLEYAVCGNPCISVEDLKQHTRYSRGLTADHPLVLSFWTTLESFSSTEMVAFLRFAWARSRLPNHWGSNRLLVVLQPGSGPEADKRLPTSETCFFNIHLPNYSTKEILREKLLYAIMDQTSLAGDSA